MLLTGLLRLFSHSIQDHQPRESIMHVGWSLPYQSLMKRMSYSFILLQHFHRGGSLLSDDSRFGQVDKKLDSTEFIFFKILLL